MPGAFISSFTVS